MLLRFGVLGSFLLTCSGQDLSVGFAGGGAVSNAFETKNVGVPNAAASFSQAKDYVVGLTLEYRLSTSVSIEGDALYRELHLDTAVVEPSGHFSVSPAPVVTWELPLMAKYRLGWGRAAPFVEAGPAFRPTSNLNANPSHYGVTGGVGVAARWKQFEITPMVRYSRWIRDRELGNLAASKSDQLELLVGVNGRPRSPWHPLSGRVDLGVIAGATLIHDVPAGSSTFAGGTTHVSGSNVPLIGPALEAPIVKGAFLEVDGFYHPIESSSRSVGINGVVVGWFGGRVGLTWEFPVLAKYKFGSGRVRPFLEGGPSFRLPNENSSLFGASVGAGVEVRVKSLKIAPGLRFTHWGAQGVHTAATRVIVDQVEFLTGFLL